MSRYLLAIDQSTSGTKALLFDHNGDVAAKAAKEHKQYYPQTGWVEHDPLEIYENVKHCILQLLQIYETSLADIAAITITNQRETALIWDHVTGLPIYNAIVWQCQRTAEACERLKEAGAGQIVIGKTGLTLDPYFSATKWSWILSQVKGSEQLLEEGRLLAGTIDSWLVWKLTEGAVHATDYSNASRTSLYNIYDLCWDEQLCQLFKVPLSILPEVKSSDQIFGYTSKTGFLGAKLPITGVIGDSQAALFGNMCLKRGMTKATYGTGTSLLMQTGSQPPTSSVGLVATIAWGRSGKVSYAMEAIIRSSGDSLKWLRDDIGLFTDFNELIDWLDKTPSNDGVYLVPAFSGLGAPHWQADARAAFTGMNRGTNKGHLLRAALESIAYQVYDAAKLLEHGTGISLEQLRADGGASTNTTLMQLQADLLDKQVSVASTAELSAKGSALMGGLAVGWWSSPQQLPHFAESLVYVPTMTREEKKEKLTGWRRAVSMVVGDR